MERRWVDAYNETQLSWRSRFKWPNDGGVQLESLFGHLQFDDVEIGEGVHDPGVITDVVAVLRVDRLVLTRRLTRLIREDKAYKTSETGTWGVNPLSALRPA
jgi:hypothetical protein